MSDIQWVDLFEDVLRNDGDIVDLADVIRFRGRNRSEEYVGANALRALCGLSVSETIEVLAWLAGERSDEELRSTVRVANREL